MKYFVVAALLLTACGDIPEPRQAASGEVKCYEYSAPAYHNGEMKIATVRHCYDPVLNLTWETTRHH